MPDGHGRAIDQPWIDLAAMAPDVPPSRNAVAAALLAAMLPALERYDRERSEEHTSELQPLMRISYAVIRLKKKKVTTKRNHTKNNKLSHTLTRRHPTRDVQ